jgi:hypothetical protein
VRNFAICLCPNDKPYSINLQGHDHPSRTLSRGLRSNRASLLDSLTEVLLSRANASTLSVEAQIAMRNLGYDPYDGDLQHFYHGVLDAAFQGPRLEATDAYRASMRAHVDHVREGASKIVAEFSRKGDERFPEEYWQRVRKCPHCKDWIDAGLQDYPTCAASEHQSDSH